MEQKWKIYILLILGSIVYLSVIMYRKETPLSTLPLLGKFSTNTSAKNSWIIQQLEYNLNTTYPTTDVLSTDIINWESAGGERTEYGMIPELEPEVKIIYGYTDWFNKWTKVVDFNQCQYKCRISTNASELNESSVLLFEFTHLQDKVLPERLNPFQYWAIIVAESSGFGFNLFKSTWDGMFNISISYKTSSTIQRSIYQPPMERREEALKPRNYAKGKTKGMLAYVSNCASVGYNRLRKMKELTFYYDLRLDLYGACGMKETTCGSKYFQDCEFHSQYRFYLSFENSLCSEYITEKFWKVLKSDHYMIPVAMGGLSAEEYRKVAPPNSFIHVDNFKSTRDLAKYLRKLTWNPQLFNKYHKWREEYKFSAIRPIPSCELCKIAHEKTPLPGIANLSSWWNNPRNCRSINLVKDLRLPNI